MLNAIDVLMTIQNQLNQVNKIKADEFKKVPSQQAILLNLILQSNEDDYGQFIR